MAEEIEVEVVYAEPSRVLRRSLRVPRGTTVATAIALSGIAADVGAAAATMPVACFGRLVERGGPVAEGDRLELLRPLRMDPKQARRLRGRERQAAAGMPASRR